MCVTFFLTAVSFDSHRESSATTAVSQQTTSPRTASSSSSENYNVPSHRPTLNDAIAFEHVEGYNVLQTIEPCDSCTDRVHTNYDTVTPLKTTPPQSPVPPHLYSLPGGEGGYLKAPTNKSNTSASMKSNPMYGGKMIF